LHASALGGSYARNGTPGQYLEFEVTGATDIYLVLIKQNNCGLGHVTINGSATLVNELPKDGSGNAYFDGYSAVQMFNQRVHIASGLTPANTYMVRVTVSGEKNASASDVRIYFEGYGTNVSGMDDPALGTVANDISVVASIGHATSALEYAISFRPSTGATNFELTGSIHLNEAISAVSWKDGDGADVVVDAETTKVAVPTLVLEQTGTSRHSETGATDHANVTCRVRFTQQGIEIYHKHAWLSAGSSVVAYMAMLGSDDAYTDRGHISGRSTVYDLTEDNDAFKGQFRSRQASLWKAGEPFVAWVYLPDLLGVNSWQSAGARVSIQDAATNNKIYVTRHDESVPPVVIGVGDEWESNHYCRLAYVPNADTLVPTM
jgi:hypothetical protein